MCSTNNRSAVDGRKVANLRNATGGIRSREASWDRVMKAFDIFFLSASGVDNGMRSPLPVADPQYPCLMS